MARPPSANSLLRNLKQQRTQSPTPIGTGLILPNHSGEHTKGIVRQSPTKDEDIANKRYVDEQLDLFSEENSARRYTGNITIENTEPGLILKDSNDNTITQFINQANTTKLKIDENATDAYSSFEITIDGTTKLFINSSGYVGIGTNEPTTTLHIAAADQYKGIKLTGGSVMETYFFPDLWRQKNIYEGAGWARSFFQITNNANVPYFNIGGYGGGQLLTYMFIGAAYNDAPFKFNPNTKNIGIGVAGASSPYAQLHVGGDILLRDANSVTQAKIVIQNYSNTTDDTAALKFEIHNSVSYPYYQKGAIIFQKKDTYSRGDMHFCLHNAANSVNAEVTDAKMTILRTGEVGIGTTAPSTVLEIKHATPTLRIGNSSTTILSGDTIGTIDFKSWDGSTNYESYTGVVASMKVIATRDYGGTGGADATIVFSTNDGTAPASADPINLVERMRINEIGKVGIGTTNPIAKLTVADDSKLGIELSPDDANDRATITCYDRVESLYKPLRIDGLTLDLRTDNATGTQVSRLLIAQDGAITISGNLTAAGYKTGSETGQTTTATIVTDVRDNAGQLQKKTQLLTFTNGLLTAKDDESDWTDTTDI